MVNDRSVLKYLSEMLIETLKLEGYCKIKYHEWHMTELKVERVKIINDKEEVQKAYDDQLKFIDDFNKGRVDLYRVIVNMNSIFRGLCYKLIIPLSEKEIA